MCEPLPPSSAHSCALPGLAAELHGAAAALPPPIGQSLCKFSVIQKFDLGGQGGVSALCWGATLSILHPPAPQILGGQLRMPELMMLMSAGGGMCLLAA